MAETSSTSTSGIRQYFARLKDFIAKAAERGIVVEICFFNSEYVVNWPNSPLYYENNIQGVGQCDYLDFQTLRHPDLLRRQSEYVSKITEEVNAYDNVILEICDEPSNFTSHAEAGPWVGHLLQVIHDTERGCPRSIWWRRRWRVRSEARWISRQVP